MSDSLFQVSDSLRQILDSLKLVRLDSLRADSLADSLEVLRPGAAQALRAGDVPPRSRPGSSPRRPGRWTQNYRLGPGDVLVLILTGDVERVAHPRGDPRGIRRHSRRWARSSSPTSRWASSRISSTRRLGRVYSGVRRGANATTKFQLSIARLRNIQVYVAGDVVRPGAYQISSAGTVLTALYAAGGPTTNGSFRQVEIRRGRTLVDSPRRLRVSAARASTRPTSGSRPATWSSSRCTARSRQGHRQGASAPRSTSCCPRRRCATRSRSPAGSIPPAYQARVTIHRILPPESRGPGGRARVVVAVGADQFSRRRGPGGTDGARATRSPSIASPTGCAVT